MQYCYIPKESLFLFTSESKFKTKHLRSRHYIEDMQNIWGTTGIKENPADFHFIHYVSCCYVYPFLWILSWIYLTHLCNKPTGRQRGPKKTMHILYTVYRNNIRFNVELTLCLIKIKGVRSFIAAELVRFREIATYVLRVFISD